MKLIGATTGSCRHHCYHPAHLLFLILERLRPHLYQILTYHTVSNYDCSGEGSASSGGYRPSGPPHVKAGDTTYVPKQVLMIIGVYMCMLRDHIYICMIKDTDVVMIKDTYVVMIKGYLCCLFGDGSLSVLLLTVV